LADRVCWGGGKGTRGRVALAACVVSGAGSLGLRGGRGFDNTGRGTRVGKVLRGVPEGSLPASRLVEADGEAT
jgi:hypothetical protein